MVWKRTVSRSIQFWISARGQSVAIVCLDDLNLNSPLNHTLPSILMPNSPTFLDLPIKVRRLVYEYAGITGQLRDLNFRFLNIYAKDEYPEKEHIEEISSFYEINYKITRREDYYTLKPYWECDSDSANIGPQTLYYPFSSLDGYSYARHSCFDDPMYFYEVSWLVFYDISKAFYSRNRYRICRGSPGGFKPFFDLHPGAVRALTILTIRLDGEPLDSIIPDEQWERISQLRPMKLHTRHGKTALKEWEKLVQRLAECMVPNRLDLYLIVNCPNIETSKAILKPLDALSTLKGCGLFLNEELKPDFMDLIHKTVKKLTSRSKDDKAKSFRYLDLPLELRYRILEHSDLVSTADLEWKPRLLSFGPLSRPSSCSCYYNWDDVLYTSGHLPDCHPVSIIEPHWFILDAHKSLETLCRHNRATNFGHLPEYNGKCVFSERHSSYASTCVKPIRAHPLFLVSHQVRQDALPIFFQKNRFLVTPPGVHFSRVVDQDIYMLLGSNAEIPMERYELSLFLSLVPPMALRHIRRLEWFVPRYENFAASPESAYFDYLDTIDMMAQAMHLPQLTLVLDLRVNRLRDLDVGVRWPLRGLRDGAMYNKIILPLQRLHGLKDCFIYLKRLKDGGDLLARDSYDSDEMRYEKAIMGDDYDSASRGKPWMERFERRIVSQEEQVQSYGYYG